MDAAEAERRIGNRDKLIALFRAHHGVWISAVTLMDVGGSMAWRTRVADARKVFAKEGGSLENRQHHPTESGSDGRGKTGAIIGEYRYLSHTPLGRDAGTPAPRGWGDGAYQPTPDDFKLTP